MGNSFAKLREILENHLTLIFQVGETNFQHAHPYIGVTILCLVTLNVSICKTYHLI